MVDLGVAHRAEMVDDAPSLFAIRKKITNIIGNHIVVGHNVS